MISVGIIGSGNMAKDMAEAFRKNEFLIKGICDIDEEKARVLAHPLDANTTTAYADLLDDPDIDLIYIATPPKTHSEIFISSLLAKKHTICEKPLCLTDNEALKMLEEAKRAKDSGIISAINFPMAYLKATKALKELVLNVHHVEIRLHFPKWPRPALRFLKTDWINQQNQGGILREISCHFLFLLEHLFKDDPVKKVCSVITYGKEGCEVGVSAILQHSHFSTNLSLASGFSSTKEEISMSIFGEKTAHLDNFQILRISKNGEEPKLHESSFGIDENAFMDSEPIVKNLKLAILQQPHELVSIAEGFRIQKLLNAIINSKGQWVVM
jgi:predicted dehydrogenase